MLRSRILGTGSYLPKRVVTNSDLEKMMETSAEWIQQRTGIRERRFVEEGEGTSDLGFQSSLRALEAAQVQPDDIDFIIFATLSPDYTFPGCGCVLQEKLGIKPIGALDVRNQCSGFIYALSVADQYIKTGTYRRILVVGAEVQSTGLELNTHGRDMGVLFGDGAGAAVLGPASEGQGHLLSTHLHAEGKYATKLWLEAPASICHPRISEEMLREGRHYPKMDGRFVFKQAVERFQEVIHEGLSANHLELKDLSLLILHQANLRIVEAVIQALKLPIEKTFNNIERYGNTTAASIPIALDEAIRTGRLHSGDVVVLAAFGSGLTWGSAIFRW